MKVSVIIPSRLQPHPTDPGGPLWLERALRSVHEQVLRPGVELELVVGLDPGGRLPEHFSGVLAVNGREPRQACAVNAAVLASSGDVLAFLEDDDFWLPPRLAYGLGLLGQFDVVTSNQREVTPTGQFVRINDFPTPSGWLLRRELWDRLGPFDESFRFHVDTDYLGRMIKARARRIHLVESGAPARPWLHHVAQFSALARTTEPDPLVVRTANPGGGMALIATNPAAGRQSHFEHTQMRQRYGVTPW